MAKRQIILTQEQLNEICGDNSTYLDGLALTPDLADNYSNEITTNGGLDGAYPDPLTTDEYGKEITKTRRVTGFGNRWGAAPTLEEMSKKDWEDKMIFNEENARLKNRKFGISNGDNGTTYYSTIKGKERLENAQQKVQSGTPEEKRKAQKTIANMLKNNPNLPLAIQQYGNAKVMDGSIKRPINVTTRSGNGKAHTPKTPSNGVFTN